ncbi:MAG: hypothetical protein ACYS47_02375 [Planctomycetota bacterium]|jgi:hypothetical protein
MKPHSALSHAVVIFGLLLGAPMVGALLVPLLLDGDGGINYFLLFIAAILWIAILIRFVFRRLRKKKAD